MLLKPAVPFDDAAIARLNDALRVQSTARAKGFLPSPTGGLLHYEYVNGRATASETTFVGAAKLVVIGRHVDPEALSFVERA